MSIITCIAIVIFFLFGGAMLITVADNWKEMTPNQIVTLLFISFLGIGTSGYLMYLAIFG